MPSLALPGREVLVGTKLIGRRLGCSARTVQRLYRDKQLHAFKLTGSPNAPLRCRSDEIDRFIAEREAT